MTQDSATAHAPETIEGWYALHQIYRRIPGAHAGGEEDVILGIDIDELARGEGWSRVVSLIGSTANIMLIHFRRSLDEIADVRSGLAEVFGQLPLELVYSFLSVTEAGLYHVTAQLAAEAEARGGSVGDEMYRAAVAEHVEAERGSEHVQRRLYPSVPVDMPYVCFYPMSKRRDPGQNWYTLPLDERSRLMHSHGTTGRRYAGRVQQIITGSIGFEKWEWGVTLFAKDPLDFKKLVTDMRFDEVSAKYAEFGDFYVGKLLDPSDDDTK